MEVFDASRQSFSVKPRQSPFETTAYGHFNGYKGSGELDKTKELKKAVEKYAD